MNVRHNVELKSILLAITLTGVIYIMMAWLGLTG